MDQIFIYFCFCKLFEEVVLLQWRTIFGYKVFVLNVDLTIKAVDSKDEIFYFSSFSGNFLISC